MGLLRTAVVFLVGAGIAIGAHFAGLFDSMPHGWNHRSWFAADDRVPPDAPPPDGAIEAVQDPEQGPESPPPYGNEYGYGAIDSPPAAGALSPVAIHVAYFPADGGEDEDSGCVPAYEVINRTGTLVLFSSGRKDGERLSRDVRIDPGASLRSQDDDPGSVNQYDTDYGGECRTGVVKIFLEKP